MDDLIAFLAARLDEDEAAAKAAQAPSPWKAAVHESDHWIVTDATGEPLIYDEGTPSLEEAAHIARHDPARVLRDVAAKRAILAEHGPASGGRDADRCRVCTAVHDGHATRFRAPCPTLLFLAAIWSDHAAYQQEWALGT
jgi:Family of unknown function (DUF6221)